jgi:exodeoxyribonuclease V beta subunit
VSGPAGVPPPAVVQPTGRPPDQPAVPDQQQTATPAAGFAEFDLWGPLPTGTTVLEASAGTGKTYAVAALVTRYVAEGVTSMERLLVVSFSRAATRELRERVRERLVGARDALERLPSRPGEHAPDDARAGDGARAGEPVDPDPLHRLLLRCDPAEQVLRAQRLRDALATFDAATVTTTHGFCQQVLTALGTVADFDPGAVQVEEATDLVDEVAADLYLRQWGAHQPGTPPLPLATYRELVKDVAADPMTDLLPAPDTPGEPGLRARVAQAIRAELHQRKRRLRIVDFDDLLVRLAGTLADPESGPVALDRLRGRYQVVLVDEFQDTDPVQWQILRDAFHGHRTLVLVGDPKQAIYRFRGADVHSYLAARAVAGQVRTLGTNWRSSAGVVAGVAALVGRAPLGNEDIRVAEVRAGRPGSVLPDTVPGPAVRLRVVPRERLERTDEDLVRVAAGRAAVIDDVVAEVTRLLAAGGVALAPHEIAVLVRSNSEAEQVSSALAAGGVPGVVASRTTVFETDAAAAWLVLLAALDQPHLRQRRRRLALSAFVGCTAAELDERGDQLDDQLGQQLRSWLATLQQRGVAALFEAVCADLDLPRRLRERPDGERLLTDVRHLAEVLHEEALAGASGVRALLGWLRRRRTDPGPLGQERARRLATDAAAVQIVTVHASKGLQFPVVLVPFAWHAGGPGRDGDPPTVVFHDDAGRRLRDVGGRDGPRWREHCVRSQQEEADDDLRVAYVALTRAQARLVVWWAPGTRTAGSAVQRLLLHDDAAVPPPRRIPVPTDEAALAAFRRRAAAFGDAFAVEVVEPRPPAAWEPAPVAGDVLRRAVFDRPLDQLWRRTSYSALTRAAHEARHADLDADAADEPADPTQPRGPTPEPAVAQTDDELDAVVDLVALPASDDDEPLRLVPSGWQDLPGGAGFGTLVHTALETLDQVGDPEALRAAVTAAAARHPGVLDADGLVDHLVTGLARAVATPLGPLAGGACLADWAPRDRLCELGFELPLAGGDGASDVSVRLPELAELWRVHVPDGPLAGYADALADLGPAILRGSLSGSLDAVLRVAGTSPRYVVVDYKTNRLAAPDEPLTTWHYRPAALARAMIDSHYPLQALLYLVALHRYLRWRQPGYDPAVHLGGALYLFLRGMAGPGVAAADGSAPGVCAWRPPVGLVTETSDWLAGGAAGVAR